MTQTTQMTPPRRLSASLMPVLAAVTLAACAPAQSPAQDPAVSRSGPENPLAGSTLSRMVAPPPGAPSGTCWQRDVTPAVIETVTERVAMPSSGAAAAAGDADRAAGPMVIRSQTHQRIVRDRKALVFETPCPPVFTPEFIKSIQRALMARGAYAGAITGHYDRPTRAALRRYQARGGLDSDILSMANARALGLVAYDFGQTP
ncbi:peptidoglycan-binding domain-containing protein [Brevirhabdus sp.]|uniref:peptidoglycan-binding domain-containing protein n=1 Tax=Brevirhabdus sp. TaxID=2004514 RepID=UPI0040587991